jgi:hypothetical protein
MKLSLLSGRRFKGSRSCREETLNLWRGNDLVDWMPGRVDAKDDVYDSPAQGKTQAL